MGKLEYLSENCVKRLKKERKLNRERYEEGSFDGIINKKEILSSKIKTRGKLQLKIPDSEAGNAERVAGDAENSMRVYKFLDLTPQQAYDERIWVYLTHVECIDYVRARWPFDHVAYEQEDTKAGQQTFRTKQDNFYLNHYFGAGNRGRTRDNGVARLWWLAHCAHMVRPDDPESVLEVLLEFQDVRANLIERPGTSMCLDVFRAVIELLEEAKVDAELEKFTERAVFREVMKNLNAKGGGLLLDSFGKEAIKALIRKLIVSGRQ